MIGNNTSEEPMTRTDQADFTRTAAALVARNDRRARLRGLTVLLRRAAECVGLAWSALVVAGVVLWLLPMNVRGA